MIKSTNEVFRNYEDYLKRVALYAKPAWSCCYSGKGGMTFEEALTEERKALDALSKVIHVAASASSAHCGCPVRYIEVTRTCECP